MMYTASRGPVGIAMVVLLAIMCLTVFLYESCDEAEMLGEALQASGRRRAFAD